MLPSKTLTNRIIEKTISFTLIFCLILGFYSCKNETFETLRFNLENDTLKPEIEIKSMIKPETNDSCLFGEVSKIYFSSQSIFILDRMFSNGLFLFNSEGKFINRTRAGRGPGEVSAPWDFIIDENKQSIQLWESLNYKMMEFDFKLNHIKTDKYPGLILNSMEKIDDDHILVFSQSNPYPMESVVDDQFFPYIYFVYQNDFSKVENKILPISPDFSSFGTDAPICKTDRVIFLSPLDFNIYSLNNYEPQIIYKLDFGNLTITETDLERGHDYILNAIRSGKKVGFLGNLFENKQFLSFSFGLGYENHFYIHSKTTGLNYYSEKLFEHNLLPQCQIKSLLEDGTFIAIANPEDISKFSFKNEKHSKQAKEINEFDNSIIITFTLNETN